jgi:uncharacterized protein DUF2795
MMPVNQVGMQELNKHLMEDVKYPATKQAILEQCNNMEHVPEAARRLLSDHLPNRVYNSAEEVLAALPV